MSSNGATETARLISAFSKLAWPVAVVILILAFRKTIAEQTRRLQTLKAAGAEATFAERVDDVLRESGKLAGQVVEVTAARQAHLLQLASTNAREAIRKGWEVVREAAQGVARRRHLGWTSTKDLVERLEEEGLLDSSAVQLILNLRSLRYDMADDPQQEITSTTATAYVTAAASAADLLAKVPGAAAISPNSGSEENVHDSEHLALQLRTTCCFRVSRSVGRVLCSRYLDHSQRDADTL